MAPVICIRCGLLQERPLDLVSDLGRFMGCDGCKQVGWVLRVHLVDDELVRWLTIHPLAPVGDND